MAIVRKAYDSVMSVARDIYGAVTGTRRELEQARAENNRLSNEVHTLQSYVDSADRTIEEYAKEAQRAKGLIGHLKEQNSALKRNLVGGFRAILEHPLLEEVGIALAQEMEDKIYLCPKSSERFGERLKGKSLSTDLGLDVHKAGFQYTEIGEKTYMADIRHLDLKDGTINYVVVFTQPTLAQRAKKVAAISHSKIIELLTRANQTVKEAEEQLAERTKGQQGGLEGLTT